MCFKLTCVQYMLVLHLVETVLTEQITYNRSCQYAVDAMEGVMFQGPELVQWSQAEQSCQMYNGTLFKPNETSFDVPLFSEWNFNDDLWVAATYINIADVVSASRQPDSIIRCEMCIIGEKCGTTCFYKACGNKCRALCKSNFEPHNLVLSDIPYSWTDANEWCLTHACAFGDKIQNASSLFTQGYCEAECFLTRKVIQVKLQVVIAPENEAGECGILHNGTLSFTSCVQHLHPICERVATTNMATTHASGRTNGTNATIITSYTYGRASTVAKESTKRTTIGLNEDMSSLYVPVGDSPHKSEKGALIGGVVGAGVILTIIIIVLVVIFMRRLKQNRNGNTNSQRPVNDNNVIKANIHVHEAYDDVCEDVTYSDKHKSNATLHLHKELYAAPSNVDESSDIARDKNSDIITNEGQIMTVLYSQVQKRLNAGKTLYNMNQSALGDDEYDKINFDKSYAQQAEHLGDVYNQTHVKCEHREDYFENVYNKTELYHELQNMHAGDVYDKANFHGGQHDKRSENAYSDEEHASPDQIHENIYDKIPLQS